MNKTFESESDALSVQPDQPTTAQPSAVTPPAQENTAPTPPSAATTSTSADADETPVPVAGNGAPDYSQLEVKTEPDLPTPDKAGGSATEPESGGGYSG
ncbi:hypothetical protein HNQ93_001079 [Hymenobacter luteus]|uniref:Uncharacterized protein n=2 Tax=Hymenobacter TaxID=89966 RepID=A0A7W9T0G4_9BACT|nr:MULTISPECIES: hypothetical protein [Hymenobacter]MBB4599442.1 hypothetical protein [Hymenobacter latericoloratus]MBB6058249.1 hypothetical protein [Hymenobacter luteus]